MTTKTLLPPIDAVTIQLKSAYGLDASTLIEVLESSDRFAILDVAKVLPIYLATILPSTHAGFSATEIISRGSSIPNTATIAALTVLQDVAKRMCTVVVIRWTEIPDVATKIASNVDGWSF